MRKYNFILVSAAMVVALPNVAAAQVQPPAPPPMPSREEMNRMTGTDAQRQYDRIIFEGLHDILVDGGKRLGQGEFEPLRAAQKAVEKKDTNKALVALARANASVTSPYGKLALGMLEIQMGTKIGDEDLSMRGTDHMIASGEAPVKILPTLYKNQATYAYLGRDLVKAEKAFGHYLALRPADADATASLAQIKANLGKRGEGLLLLDKAISMKRTSGQPVPEIWLRVASQTRASLASK